MLIMYYYYFCEHYYHYYHYYIIIIVIIIVIIVIIVVIVVVVINIICNLMLLSNKKPNKKFFSFSYCIKMPNLSLNGLKQIAKIRRIKSYKNMSKERLLSALDESKRNSIERSVNNFY